jgi:translation initiation factor 3 subunit F
MIASSPALLWHDATSSAPTSESTVTAVMVHPLVILHLLDHHTRRPEAEGRVIGTLLGRRRDGSSTVLEVTNAFAVPHAELGEEVAIGKAYNKDMLHLYSRAYKKETVVGWYASAIPSSTTSSSESKEEPSSLPMVADTSSLIHDFYASETEEGEPIHLVVDTRLTNNQLNIKAYKSTQVILQGESVGHMFHELPLFLKSNEPESICMHAMIQEQQTDLPTEEDTAVTLQASLEQLYASLEQVVQYVDKVVEDGNPPASAAVGRQIADTLATLPRIRPEVLDRLFHDSLQDVLMVTYLSNITRTHMMLAEQLNASLS